MNLVSAAFRNIRQIICAWGVGTAFLVSSYCASAQEVGQAKIVKDIDVQYVGAPTVAEDRILSYMSLKTGDAFTPGAVEEDIKSIYNSGEVENIRILSEPLGGGVRVIVVVQTRSLLGQVMFTGNTVFPTDKLKKEASLSEGGAINEEDIQKARTKVLDLYRKNGYPEATINYRLSAPNKQGYSDLIFTMDEGGRGVLRKIEFVGNSVFDSGELRKQMDQKQKSVFSLFSKAGRIDQTTIENDVQKIEDHYQNHGYLNAQVVDVRRVRVDDEQVDLIITIEEGQMWTVNDVRVNGINVLDIGTEVSPYLKIQGGQTYSGQFLKDDLQLIQDQYGSQGYADAAVEPQLIAAGPNQVDVIYDVTEGRRFSVGRINIAGNDKTKEEVIRRELAIDPGDEFDTVRIDASRQRLVNLNYFSSVDVMPVDTSYLDVKDLNIRVTEKPTGTINFGAGFSSIDNLVGFVDVSQGNFDLGNWPSMTGAGQKFRMSLKYGTERRDFVMSLTEPWFMGQRLALGGEVFFRDLLFLSDQYDQRQYGGAISLRKPVGEFSYVRVEYRPQMYEIFDVEDDASEEIRSEEGEFFDSNLAISYVYDTRDSLFLPRNGHRVALGADYSGLGGDVDTYGVNASAAKYFNLPLDGILTVGGNIDIVDGDPAPIFKRVFRGGSNDLRGFDYRDVGPKDEFGEPLGGGTGVDAVVEYTFPLIGDKVRGALFYDIGVVNEDSWDFDFGDYNSDFGFGVRLFILGGAPVRLDYAIPLEADEFNDDGGRFNFTFGYQF